MGLSFPHIQQAWSAAAIGAGLQVVLGVLGCPNLPQQAISEEDCDEGQAGRSFSDETIGTMFAAAKGQVRHVCTRCPACGVGCRWENNELRALL